MTIQWLNVEEDMADAFSAEFWRTHRNDLKTGNFWADRIKNLRGEPIERLRLALSNLPLPAAFREAALATRTLIRQFRQEHRPYDDMLAFFYWLAAVYSFPLAYSEKLKEPGYNILETIPGKKVISLPFSYLQLGYEKLDLLNKTDIKWLMESWGEPNAHTTMNALHRSLWDEYELKLLSKRNCSPAY